jgi:hypothetical protein
LTSVGRVERAIRRVEGFEVRIKYLQGSDVRSDRTRMPFWPYRVAAKDAWSVATWKLERFTPRYPGFVVDVLDAKRNRVRGQTRLRTVRESYQINGSRRY